MSAARSESSLRKRIENRFAWLGMATTGALFLAAYAIEAIARVMANVLARVGFLDYLPGPTELAFDVLRTDLHWVSAGVCTAAIIVCWTWLRAYFAHACAIIAVMTITLAAAATFAIAMPLLTLCGSMMPQWPDALLQLKTPGEAEMPQLGARAGECVV